MKRSIYLILALLLAVVTLSASEQVPYPVFFSDSVIELEAAQGPCHPLCVIGPDECEKDCP